MNYQTFDYPFYPEGWPHTEYQYRVTFRTSLREDQWHYDAAHNEADSYLHAGRLTDMITSHLHLWEMRTEVRDGGLILYCKEVGWLAILKMAHGSDLKSPIQSLARIESWSTHERPISKHMDLLNK